jgi:hypothetical protein
LQPALNDPLGLFQGCDRSANKAVLQNSVITNDDNNFHFI